VINHTSIRSLAETKSEVLTAIKEDTKMFEYILEYLLLTNNDNERIWFPLMEIFDGKQVYQDY